MEEEEYYLVFDDTNGLSIVTSVEAYMRESNVSVCEVFRHESIDDALDCYNDAMNKIEEHKKEERLKKK
jgi:hypothetical protein